MLRHRYDQLFTENKPEGRWYTTTTVYAKNKKMAPKPRKASGNQQQAGGMAKVQKTAAVAFTSAVMAADGGGVPLDAAGRRSGEVAQLLQPEQRKIARRSHLQLLI